MNFNPINEEDLIPFLEKLSYTYSNKSHLLEALTHKSYINETKNKSGKNNEILEFLGDAVLDLIMSEHLIKLYPELFEGQLSKMKSRLVNENTLARIAEKINLGIYILIGRGEEITGGRKKVSLLSDAFEAIIASIYVDGGLEKAREFILTKFSQEINELSVQKISIDYKTEVQEICQFKFELLPTYSIVKETGPDHQKIFEVNMNIKEEIYGIGIGHSKKDAEQKAAKMAIERLISEFGDIKR